MILGISFFVGTLLASVWMKRYDILPYSCVFSLIVILIDILWV